MQLLTDTVGNVDWMLSNKNRKRGEKNTKETVSVGKLGTTKKKNWCETTTFQLDSIKLYIGTQSFSDKAFMNASAVLQ